MGYVLQLNPYFRCIFNMYAWFSLLLKFPTCVLVLLAPSATVQLFMFLSFREGGIFIITKIQRAKPYIVPPKEANAAITTQDNPG